MKEDENYSLARGNALLKFPLIDGYLSGITQSDEGYSKLLESQRAIVRKEIPPEEMRDYISSCSQQVIALQDVGIFPTMSDQNIENLFANIELTMYAGLLLGNNAKGFSVEIIEQWNNRLGLWNQDEYKELIANEERYDAVKNLINTVIETGIGMRNIISSNMLEGLLTRRRLETYEPWTDRNRFSLN